MHINIIDCVVNVFMYSHIFTKIVPSTILIHTYIHNMHYMHTHTHIHRCFRAKLDMNPNGGKRTLDEDVAEERERLIELAKLRKGRGKGMYVYACIYM